MAKTEKLWRKKRTSRGRNFQGISRKISGENSRKISLKKASREIYKNQKWYSHYLLKFVLCAIFAIFWLRISFKIPFLNFVFPVGFCAGFLVILFEKNLANRGIEFAILLIFAGFSFFSPIGIIL